MGVKPLVSPSNSEPTVYTAGPDLREGKLGSCSGPPQLGGPPQKTVKNYYLSKHKKILFETDNQEYKYDVSLFI